MGEISYSTYLIHNLVIAATILFIIQYNLFAFEIWMVPLSAIVLTYLLAFFMYRYIEQPGIKVGRGLARRFIRQSIHGASPVSADER